VSLTVHLYFVEWKLLKKDFWSTMMTCVFVVFGTNMIKLIIS